MPRPPIPLLLLFSLLALLAVYTIWIQPYRNNFFTLMRSLRSLPDTSQSPCPHVPLDKRYFGVDVLDDTFTGMECAWGTMVDGSHPGLALFAFMHSGFLAAAAAILWVEGLKGEFRGTWVARPTLWLLLATFYSFGVVMPVYYIVHLTTRTYLASHSSHRSAAPPDLLLQLKTVPWSIAIGYIVPSVLMCWPGFEPAAHRTWTLIWGVNPIWVLLTQSCLVPLLGLFKFAPRNKSTADIVSDSEGWLVMKDTYIFGSRCAAFTHFWALSVMVTCAFFPEIFMPEIGKQFRFGNVLVPPAFWREYQVESLGEGMLVLVQYDMHIAAFSGMIWTLYMGFEASTAMDMLEKLKIFSQAAKLLVLITALGSASGITEGKMFADKMLYEGNKGITKIKEG